ncbi:complement C1q tumor necrosis factor-related protein 1 [Talpa occidentalis]|uniref:complement C1q tumor necrosis factor-related protein 1 n=1 Tax=Talpa occidentalis TaxID=50954 RepID=UPI00188F31EB|nr:complement C1q tumor necrosis factor-related protein 1 [Talpa occidentalis]
MGSRGLGLLLTSGLLLAFAWGPALGRTPHGQPEQEEPEATKEPSPPPDHTERDEEKHEKYSPGPGEEPPASRCFRCCDPSPPVYPTIPAPQINITILKGQSLPSWSLMVLSLANPPACGQHIRLEGICWPGRWLSVGVR